MQPVEGRDRGIPDRQMPGTRKSFVSGMPSVFAIPNDDYAC
jgi:hypothetical protein